MRAGRARPVPRSPSVTLWPHRRDASVTVPGTGRGPTGHVGEGWRGTIGRFLRVPRTGGDQTVASSSGFRPGEQLFAVPFAVPRIGRGPIGHVARGRRRTIGS